MSVRRVYLARHGGLGLPAGDKWYVGQLDLPLSDEGIRQAERFATAFSQLDLAAIYCSDLQRSRETAEVVGQRVGITPIVRRDLREVSLGTWEGLTFAEVRRRYPDEFARRGQDIAGYRPPGGESFAECACRVLAAFEEVIRAPSEARGAAGDHSIAIVGHAGVNRIILCHVLGLPLASLFRLGQEYGCLSVVEFGTFGARLRLLNALREPRTIPNDSSPELLGSDLAMPRLVDAVGQGAPR